MAARFYAEKIPGTDDARVGKKTRGGRDQIIVVCQQYGPDERIALKNAQAIVAALTYKLPLPREWWLWYDGENFAEVRVMVRGATHIIGTVAHKSTVDMLQSRGVSMTDHLSIPLG